MLMTFFTSFFLLTNQMIGALMPGATVNAYGQISLDINRTRAAVYAAIPPNTVAESTRANKITLEIEKITALIDEYNILFLKKGKEVITLYQTYGSRPDDFQKIFSELDAEKAKGQKEIVEARFNMKKLMTQAEWNAVFNPPPPGQGS
jgi:hypothetical protein